MRPASLRECAAEFLEILARQVESEPGLTERLDEVLASGVVETPRSRRQFAGAEECLLGCEKAVGKIANGESVALRSGCPPGLEVVSLVEVLGKRRVRIRPEVMQSAANLLCPLARLV